MQLGDAYKFFGVLSELATFSSSESTPTLLSVLLTQNLSSCDFVFQLSVNLVDIHFGC